VKCSHLVPEPNSRWGRHVVSGSKVIAFTCWKIAKESCSKIKELKITNKKR
jgi:hypothetical protein